jgi:hypothetical protein
MGNCPKDLQSNEGCSKVLALYLFFIIGETFNVVIHEGLTINKIQGVQLFISMKDQVIT